MLDFCYHSAKAKCKTDKDCDKYERCDRNSICGKYRFTICVVPFNKFVVDIYLYTYTYTYTYVFIHVGPRVSIGRPFVAEGMTRTTVSHSRGDGYGSFTRSWAVRSSSQTMVNASADQETGHRWLEQAEGNMRLLHLLPRTPFTCYLLKHRLIFYCCHRGLPWMKLDTLRYATDLPVNF